MENVPVSTKTIIATSNLQFDIVHVFETLPLEGREGDVYVKLLYYQNQTRGDDSLLKKKNKKCFRNAVNVILQVEENKNVNFKLSKNGKFQLTGCKNEHHAIQAVSFFIRQLFRYCREYITMTPGVPEVLVYFQTVMTNIDFSVGFCVDRQKLDHLLNQNTPFHSLLETSFGYTGVNIKFPLTLPWWKMNVPVVRMSTTDDFPWTLDYESMESVGTFTNDQLTKKKYNTFLVFHSGNVIMSGMTKETMKDHFDCFQGMIREWRDQIEEKLKN
jgi:TATA-box binding protein (TBP) (component of TFIID and TFIIIB)